MDYVFQILIAIAAALTTHLLILITNPAANDKERKKRFKIWIAVYTIFIIGAILNVQKERKVEDKKVKNEQKITVPPTTIVDSSTADIKKDSIKDDTTTVTIIKDTSKNTSHYSTIVDTTILISHTFPTKINVSVGDSIFVDSEGEIIIDGILNKFLTDYKKIIPPEKFTCTPYGVDIRLGTGLATRKVSNYNLGSVMIQLYGSNVWVNCGDSYFCKTEYEGRLVIGVNVRDEATVKGKYKVRLRLMKYSP